MSPERIAARLARQAEGADIVIVEGVMGLFDGGQGGAGSTASLAALTGLPVLLVVGAQGLAQTAAAVAEGCARLAEGFSSRRRDREPGRLGRHADLVREGFQRALRAAARPGAARRFDRASVAASRPGAGGGACGSRREDRAGRGVGGGGMRSRAIVKRRDGSLSPLGGGERRGGKGRCAASAALRYPSPSPSPQGGGGLAPLGQRIAVARDIAFAFAYPHLLQDWREQGAEISFFSPLADEAPSPDADAVFLPGGYPELHAGRIAAAAKFRAGMQQPPSAAR